jgi:LmbE family N-acetylglucosaminyl deacetylase
MEPAELLPGRVLVAVPHMDDAVLACGGTLRQLPDASEVHLVYASDGRASPEPVLPWRDRVDDDLFPIRREEARAALARLGVPGDQLHFLELPDGRLRRHRASLVAGLRELTQRIAPERLLIPFRFDQNLDHLAVSRAGFEAAEAIGASVVEYFVYYRLRLLPGGDLRAYLRPEQRVEVDIAAAARDKRAALDCFTSQVTRFYPWQTRPNLTPALLDEVSAGPETFLPGVPRDASPFARASTRIRLLHALEPRLKRPKDRALAIARRGIRRGA